MVLLVDIISITNGYPYNFNNYCYLDDHIFDCVSARDIVDVIKNTKREIIVAMGVLEHIYSLHDVLTAIKDNNKIIY